MQAVRVGMLGLGTVGGGTLAVLRRNAEEISRRAGRAIEVTHAVVRDPSRTRGVPLDGLQVSADPASVVDNPDIDIVCELMGGTEPARSLVLRALANGKPVVTANKALIATHGNEVFAAARDAGLMVAFEAAVAGGIPIIKTLREGLAGNRIEGLAGIINGTCNFILSAMKNRGLEFDQALNEAQALGYAEADPAFDIEGVDAAHKLTILASIAFGIPLNFERVHVEGITGVHRADVEHAAELGYRVKLLGIARRVPAGIELRVHPTLVPSQQLIANVEGVLNAVMVQGDALGPLLLSGAGAGAEATASAVVADLVDVVRVSTADPDNRVPHLAFQPEYIFEQPVVPIDEVRCSFYLRMLAEDRPGVLAEVGRIFAEHDISLEAVLQKAPSGHNKHVPIVFLTSVVRERALRDSLARIGELPSIRGDVVSIRIEAFSPGH
jgi:homoserine dehydrogenase